MLWHFCCFDVIRPKASGASTHQNYTCSRGVIPCRWNNWCDIIRGGFWCWFRDESRKWCAISYNSHWANAGYRYLFWMPKQDFTSRQWTACDTEGIILITGDRQIVVRWFPNGERDLAGYRVWRSQDGQDLTQNCHPRKIWLSICRS